MEGAPGVPKIGGCIPLFCFFNGVRLQGCQGFYRQCLANGGLARKAPIGAGPGKTPTSPEKARFSRTDFFPIFSENLGLKRPFVRPRFDFPNHGFSFTGALTGEHEFYP